MTMKWIIAIIQPHKLDAVRDALAEIGVNGMSVTETKGYGRQRGHTEVYRGTEYQIDYLPKLKLEIGVDDAQLDSVLDAIQNSAKTGRIGDGKIFVTDLTSVTRIRTGETDSDAL